MNTIALRLMVTYKILGARLRAIPAERGATAVEYALLVGLIAAAIAAIVITLGGQVSDLFGDTRDAVPAKD